ncbi:uncharacterized protein FFMR_12541 [Fusarium fujikuroi]|nr:uncharacterized protein FFMR_12541 [Fusarium fujikuroi]
MTNTDDKKKTQKDPNSKRKGKDDDKHLTNRAGAQSGQQNPSARGDETGSGLAIKHPAKPRRSATLPANVSALGSSVDKIGQTDMSFVKQNTSAPINNEMGITRGIPVDVPGFGQLSGPGEVLTTAFRGAQPSNFVQEGSKQKFVGITSTPESRLLDDSRKTILAQRSSVQQKNDAEAENGGQDQGYRPRKRQRRPFCVGCKSDQHYIDRCLKASDNGLMKGCPVCNTLEHSAEDCNSPRVLDDVDRTCEFVYRRRNMPSFLTFESWYDLVRDNASPAPTNMDRFPWTPEFTKSISAAIDDLQQKVNDLGLEDAKLPVDPSVNGWTAVKGHFNEKAPTATMDQSEEPELPFTMTEEAPAQVESQSGVAPVPEQEPVTAPTDEPSLFAVAKKQQENSRRRPWDEDSEVEDDEVDSDDDEANRRKMQRMRRAERSEMVLRASSHTPGE